MSYRGKICGTSKREEILEGVPSITSGIVTRLVSCASFHENRILHSGELPPVSMSTGRELPSRAGVAEEVPLAAAVRLPRDGGVGAGAHRQPRAGRGLRGPAAGAAFAARGCEATESALQVQGGGVRVRGDVSHEDPGEALGGEEEDGVQHGRERSQRTETSGKDDRDRRKWE
ncbi:unnamed protein product [Darwinula stevensoni]|uniref:Uncharacterized protein n=1 Tax=Darwinula stevensoni TaxID=69355 RepID=A0A7R9AFG9_9CRUS|nr:unnamed protein product [Darwinula stevensoni]CAG0902635.1 unnamed protein product [Darwinula stevensoni]